MSDLKSLREASEQSMTDADWESWMRKPTAPHPVVAYAKALRAEVEALREIVKVGRLSFSRECYEAKIEEIEGWRKECGVVQDDPRIGYVTVQVPRKLWEGA
jgi:hypothetical protein